MGNKSLVLVADDDQSINQLLVHALALKFNVQSSYSGTETLQFCAKQIPDVILLDVNLGDVDGREICKKLKKQHGDKAPLILFISGDSNQESVINCFEHGADDFIAKPFSPPQVLAKVEALVKYHDVIVDLQCQSKELSSLITTTMSQASSYGASLQMVKELNHAFTEAEIAQTVFQFLESQGLHAAIYFRQNNQSLFFDQSGKDCSPIVKEVFELIHNKKRIQKFGNRLMVSDHHSSILVLDPPQDDDESYGIFIDIITVIIEALEARFIAFLREKELQILNRELSNVISQISIDVKKVDKDKKQLLEDIIAQIGLSFHKLDLTIEQEEYFTKLMEKTLASHDQNNTALTGLQNKLQSLVNEMEALLK